MQFPGDSGRVPPDIPVNYNKNHFLMQYEAGRLKKYNPALRMIPIHPGISNTTGIIQS